MTITIKEVAKVCKLSTVTVSRALRNDPVVADKTRRKVADVARQIGYSPNLLARNLQSGKTSMVAVIHNDFAFEHIGKMIQGAQKSLHMNDYELIVYEWNETDDFLGTLIGRGIEGILMVQWGHDKELEFFREIYSRKIPLVSLDKDRGLPGVSVVGTQDYQGAVAGVEHLVSKGHKQIGHISGPALRTSSKERLRGFYDVMGKYHLQVKSEWIVNGDFRYEGAMIAVENFFKDNIQLPTAIFLQVATY